MKTIFVVQAQGLGDNEYAFENIAAFTMQAKAAAHIAMLQKQDAADDNDFVYNIEQLTLKA